MYNKKLIPAPLLIFIDIILAGISLCVFAYFHHVRPSSDRIDVTQIEQQMNNSNSSNSSSNSSSNTDNSDDSNDSNSQSGSDSSSGTNSNGFTNFSSTFADKFSTSEGSYSDDTYVGQNCNVTVKKVSSDNLTYYVQDIYVRTVEYLRTGFAEDSYGKSITQWPQDMAASKNAVAAINGDYYGIHDTGLVIRNGYAYRTSLDGSNDLCIIYKNGEMKTFSCNDINVDTEIANGAYQAWSFGPQLVVDGQAQSGFGRNRIAQSNPRTGIGYYEPGHYCFITVDGRNENGSDGVTLDEFAQIFAELGCKSAYNLDGGKSSIMVFNNNTVNSPSDGGRQSSDIVYVCDNY